MRKSENLAISNNITELKIQNTKKKKLKSIKIILGNFINDYNKKIYMMNFN